jgi:hypothetical protein
MAKDIVAVKAGSEVAVNQTVHGDPVNLTTQIGSLVEGLQSALGTMKPHDLSLEIDAHSDANRSTARVRFRAYRRRESE